MATVGRNDPCPCGSGKKYKKCCLAKDQAASLANAPVVTPSGQRFLSSRSASPMRPDALTWPVARVLVPRPAVWQATGLGTAGVVRAQPDGRYASAFFVMSLEDHGLKGLFGKDDASMDEIDALLAGVHGLVPPWCDGPLALASEFAWGARSVSEAAGSEFPESDLRRYFGLLAPPPGAASDWHARLVGPGGLTPLELVEVIAAGPPADELPEGKAVAVFTNVTFDLFDTADALQKLRAPEFVQEESGTRGGLVVRTWMPTGGGARGRDAPRKMQGKVAIGSGELSATAMTLSMAARLLGTLEDLLGDSARPREVQWRAAYEVAAGLPGCGAVLKSQWA
jgi:hypothetical protein